MQVTNSAQSKLLDSLLSRYRRYKTARTNLDPEHAQRTAYLLLRKARYLFLITQANQDDSTSDNTGWSSARYVQPIVEWHGRCFTIWIGTSASSRKIVEIKNNPKVTIAIGNDSAGANLIVYGHASLHTDVAIRRRYWKRVWNLFFTKGPDDDDCIVVKIEPQRIELMDLKSNITPEPFGLKPLVLAPNADGWHQLG